MKNDLVEKMAACIEGWLHEVKVDMYERSSAVVVIAAGGYPGNFCKGNLVQIDPHKVE
jgi:phosphoribosylamine-glycine ligase